MLFASRYCVILGCFITACLLCRASGMKLQTVTLETVATMPVRALDKAVYHKLNAIVVYQAAAGNKWKLMRNNEVLGTFDEILTDSVWMPPKGNSVLAIVRTNGKYAVLHNDEMIGPPIDAVQEGSLQFGPIYDQVIYVARDGEQSYVLYKDNMHKILYGKPYAQIQQDSIRFTQDGFTWAYNAQVNDKWCVVYWEKEDPLYDEVTPVIFPEGGTMDNKHRVYTARIKESWHLCIDGFCGRQFESIGKPLIGNPVKNSAGKIDYFAEIYYKAKYKGKWVMIKFTSINAVNGTDVDIDKVFKKKYLGVKLYGPCGEDWAFIPNGQKGILDQPAGKQYDNIDKTILSPDRQRIAYTAQTGKAWFVVDGEKESPPYDAAGEVQFSADSKHLLYAAETAGKWRSAS